jgi:histidyl-tRNA synthetase
MHTLNVKTADFFKRAVAVAEHYGFRHVDDIATPSRKTAQRSFGLMQHKSEPTAVAEDSFTKGFSNQAVQDAALRKESLLFYTPSLVAHKGSPSKRLSAFTLSMVGNRQPLSEVLVLKTALGILHELGLDDVVVRVNSIGDADSSARYLREVNAHVRKRLSDIPEKYQSLARSDPLGLFDTLQAEGHDFVQDFPRPVEYLTSPSRKHFKELLEFLEETEVPFMLHDRLMANRSMYAHSIFDIVRTGDIDAEGTIEPVARGGRYDELTRTFSRRAVPAVGIVLAFAAKDATREVSRPRSARPRACLIQVGHEARLLSFSVVEKFRQARIPIEQCLQFDKFSEQLAYAEARRTPFVIIIGHKEAQERMVIVRNSQNRSQETIAIDMLPHYFKAPA